MADIAKILSAAIASFETGQMADAERLCQEILSIHPEHPDALQIIGLVRTQRGDPAGGAEFIRRAIGVRPDMAEYHSNLGRVLMLLKDRAGAIAAFRRTVELAPRDGDTLTQLAIQLAANAELDAATEVLARAVQADGTPTEALTLYACCLQDRGDRAGAEAVLRRALTMPPDNFYPAERYLEALGKGLFFGFLGGGMQGNSARQVFMSAAVHRLRGLGRQLQILEIGSYMGASALTWAHAVDRLFDGPARLLCVDTWDYLSTEAPNEWMALSLKSGMAYRAFLSNVATAPRSTTIEHARGRGIDVMGTLGKVSYDIVYIDGSHAYTDVVADIEAGRRVVRDGGFLCGDDLECQLHECDEDFARRNAMTDYIFDPPTGPPFHPGVTLAVAEKLGRVSSYDGFWIMRRSGDRLEPVDLAGSTGLIPPHWPKVTRDMLREKFSASGALRNIIE